MKATTVDVRLSVEVCGRSLGEVLSVGGVKLWLPLDEAEFPLLGRVDLWGDTVFNGLQLPGVVAELVAVRQWMRDSKDAGDVGPGDLKLMDQVIDLARRGLDEVHLYLHFVGD